MTLKNQLDDILRRVYFLTETIKKLVPIHGFTKNSRTNLVIVEVLNEYKTVSSKAIELLDQYIQQQRSTTGTTPLEYVRIRRKLGQKDVE